MATVHRAKKQGIAGFERQVALKRMLPHLSEDDDFVESFIREAKVASMLVHPNVAQIYDFGKVAETYFIAMELVDGPDVRRLLRYARRVGQLIPLPVVLALLSETCEALHYAHTFVDDDTGEPLDIVHRDVSPSNLIVAPTGHMKVIDFGIAKASSAQLHTDGGRVKGKYAYMAPEAAAGMALGSASDVFSLGVVAHEMLTLRPLFSATTDLETIMKIREAPIPRPSDHNASVPPGLDDVVLVALARNPHDRLPSAGAFRSMLDEVSRYAGLHWSARDVQDWLAQIPPEEGGRVSGRASMRNSRATAGPPTPGYTPSDQPYAMRDRLPLAAPPETAIARKSTPTGSPPQSNPPGVHAQSRTTAPAMPMLDFSISLPSPMRGAPHQPPQPPQQTPEYTPSSQSLPVVPFPNHPSHPSVSQNARPSLAPMHLQQPTPDVRKKSWPLLLLLLAIAGGAFAVAMVAMSGGNDEPAKPTSEPIAKTEVGSATAQPMPATGGGSSVPAAREPSVLPATGSGEVPDTDPSDEPTATPVDAQLAKVDEGGNERDKPDKPRKPDRDKKHGKDDPDPRKPEVAVVTPPPDDPDPVKQPDPPVQPVKPPVQPVKPPVQPVKPPVQPVKPATTPVVTAGAVKKISGELPTLKSSGGATSGQVMAKVCIGESGKVSSVEIKKSPPGVSTDLAAAIKTWKYAPYKNPDGDVTPVCFLYNVKIVLKSAD
jgi:serine/threonine-protein kinase